MNPIISYRFYYLFDDSDNDNDRDDDDDDRSSKARKLSSAEVNGLAVRNFVRN